MLSATPRRHYPKLLQNVISHEAPHSPRFISGLEQNISVLFGSDTIFNLFPRKWRQGVAGVGSGRRGRTAGLWGRGNEHFQEQERDIGQGARVKTMVMSDV